MSEAQLEESTVTVAQERFWNHSVALWTLQVAGPQYGDEDIDKVCDMLKRQRIRCVDIPPYHLWDAIYENGMKVGCALPPMDPDSPFGLTLAHSDHEVVERGVISIKDAVDRCQQRGIKFVIVFTGLAKKNSALTALTVQTRLIHRFIKLAQYAYDRGVMLVLEQLNTVDKREMKGHPGYYGQITPYCGRIARAVNEKLNYHNKTSGKTYLGLVFDFYHQLKMGEDSLELIKKYGDLVEYVHTASVPDRQELHAVSKPDYVGLSRALREKKGDKGKGLMFMQEWTSTSFDPVVVEQNIGLAVKLCETF